MLSLSDFNDVPERELREKLGISMNELARVITLDSVIKLVDSFGGLEIYIPNRAKKSSKLIQIIGMDDLVSLCQHYHGTVIKIPRLMTLRLMLRNQKICKARNEGIPLSELARKFNLTQRQIHNILSE